MKAVTTTFSALMLWYALGNAEEPVKVESETDQAIYSLGFELGNDLKGQELNLKSEILLQGIKDAMEGNKPLVNTLSRAKALKEIKEQRARGYLEKSQAFLLENGKKEGVITIESGLQYKVFKEGEGKSPQPNDTVVVDYRGSLIDGTEFDSSYKRGKPASFQVQRVIKGWKEGLQMMKEGAKWELYIPPELAYGTLGRQNSIPPNSALIFEVELKSIK